MITVKISEEDLLDMLMNRLADWTPDETTTELFEKMYNDYVYGGCFDEWEFDIQGVVDNDYVNWCSVVTEDDDEFEDIKKVYDKQGIGDCSCEDCVGNFIEAVNDDETAFLIRY